MRILLFAFVALASPQGKPCGSDCRAPYRCMRTPSRRRICELPCSPHAKRKKDRCPDGQHCVGSKYGAACHPIELF